MKYQYHKLMDKPGVLISIVVATYNSGKVLQTCLDSIRGQSYKNFELIVIDGGSTDNTIELITRNTDLITTWITEPDNGIYDAWNKGIERSSGQWIMFVGSDDELHKDAVQSYTEAINIGATDVEYISGKVQLVSSSGNIIKTIGEKWRWDVFRRYMNVAHVASIHSVNYFKKYGNFDTNFKIAGDYELLLRAGNSLKADFINRVVANMAFGGVSSGNSSVFKEAFKAKRYSGKLNVYVCYYDDVVARLKFTIKSILGYGR